MFLFGQHRERRCATLHQFQRQRRRMKAPPYQSFRGRSLFQLGNHGDARLGRRPQGFLESARRVLSRLLLQGRNRQVLLCCCHSQSSRGNNLVQGGGHVVLRLYASNTRFRSFRMSSTLVKNRRTLFPFGAARSTLMQRPTGVAVIAVLYWLSALMLLVLGSVMAVG